MTTAHEIYVALLGEGTEVWRPVEAKSIGNNVFLLQGKIPSGESWQFTPGTQVRCKEYIFAGGEHGLVAVEAIYA
nr:hypothetical protein [uncultured Methylotenera sp.]